MRISDWSSDVCSSDLRALFRQEIRHRQIALAGVIVEAQHPRAIGHAGKLLGDRSQRRAGRDADEQALLPRRAAGIFLRVVRIDLDHPVQHPRMEVGGHEARAYPLRSEEHTSELQSLMRNPY